MKNIQRKSSDFTAETFNTTTVYYEIDTSSSNVTATLQPASEQTGQEYVFYHKTAGNTLTVVGEDGADIDGSSNYTSIAVDDYIHIISNGVEWVVIATSNSITELDFETGTTKQGSTASIIRFNDPDGNEVFELGSYTDSDKYVELNMLCPSGENAQIQRYLTNDFSQGIDHRSLLETLVCSDDGINDVLFNVEGWTDDGGSSGGSFDVRAACSTNTAEISFSANGGGGSSNASKYEIHGVNVSALDATDGRFVWKQGNSNPEIMVLGESGTLQVKQDVRARQLIADGDNAGIASTNALTGSTDTPTSGYNWDGTGSSPNGYMKIYVGTQAAVIPYWNT